MKQNLKKLGEVIRNQSGLGSGKMSELVFNPSKGEFETKSAGSKLDDGEMNVTEMTREGFALEAETIVCHDMEELETLLKLYGDDGALEGYGIVVSKHLTQILTPE